MILMKSATFRYTGRGRDRVVWVVILHSYGCGESCVSTLGTYISVWGGGKGLGNVGVCKFIVPVIGNMEGQVICIEWFRFQG